MPPPAATQAAARLWTARVARCSFRLLFLLNYLVNCQNICFFFRLLERHDGNLYYEEALRFQVTHEVPWTAGEDARKCLVKFQKEQFAMNHSEFHLKYFKINPDSLRIPHWLVWWSLQSDWQVKCVQCVWPLLLQTAITSADTWVFKIVDRNVMVGVATSSNYTRTHWPTLLLWPYTIDFRQADIASEFYQRRLLLLGELIPLCRWLRWQATCILLYRCTDYRLSFFLRNRKFLMNDIQSKRCITLYHELESLHKLPPPSFQKWQFLELTFMPFRR